MTIARDRDTLLRVAREAIVARLSGAEVVFAAEPSLERHAAAFVTLHLRGELRGCIGHVEPNEALLHVVARCAAAAATSDPRFPAVSASEVPELEIEISILGPLEAVTSSDQIEIGRHGLMIERASERGLLLPQVASERNWTAATFLAETCHKAGLPRDAWKAGASVWRFEAEIFGEHF
jgi:AmmeMemoRadiSam system protein A